MEKNERDGSSPGPDEDDDSARSAVGISEIDADAHDDYEDETEDDSFMGKIARAPAMALGASPPKAEDFRGTARFAVETLLGSGACGDVYRVFDRERGVPLALKRLRQPEARWLYRFKREFRSLSRVVHPNLVTLYDLVTSEEAAFFTMELIEGEDFRAWILPGGELDLGRLRAALAQLAEGIAFLHRHRMIHRDLKPSNVLVTSEGRVVILDFGLISDVGFVTHAGKVAGTPAFMSPEQAKGAEISPATDWYSLGVMLFEALTGRLPFRGSAHEIMQRKQREEAPRANELAHGVPEDLGALCEELLRRDPLGRPSGAEVLRRVRERGAGLGEDASDLGGGGASLFQGRSRERAELAAAYRESQSGKPTWVVVHGSSGMGKTALLDRFLAEASEAAADVLVLRGACYEREAVAYKGLDGVIDALSSFLRRQEPKAVAETLGSEGAKLSPLFPVLGLFSTASAPPEGAAAARDARQRFREAAIALRTLLRRLSETHRVIVAIDDLQWGDFDSVELIAEVLDSAAAPPLLLVTCYRSEEVDTNPVLALVSQWRARFADTRRIVAREVAVARLAPEDAKALAAALLGEDVAGELAEKIAVEAAGNPYFIDELSRHRELTVAAVERGSPRVAEAILRRVGRLPESAQRILRAVAVAAFPVATSLACEAAGMGFVDPAALAALRAGRLIRSRVEGGQEELECYHDRIRESLVGDLSPQVLREQNASLAVVLERAAADPERIATHFRDGGELRKAAKYMLSAAERASVALAFERAARLYGEALELDPDLSESERRGLQIKIGDALANAGRGAAASDAYSAAAQGAPAEVRGSLRLRAAEQLFRGGPPGDAIHASLLALRALGIRVPRTRFGTMLLLAWLRVRLLFKKRRLEARPDPKGLDRVRLDSGWFVANAVLAVDPLLGLYLHTDNLIRNLRLGSKLHLLKSLCTEATVLSLRPSGWRASDEIYRDAQRLTEDLPAEYRAYLLTARSLMLASKLQMRDCAVASAEAERLYRERLVGTASEASLVHFFELFSLFYLGQWRAVCAGYERFRHEAEQRDDLHWQYLGEAHYGWIEPILRDDVPAARQVAERLERLDERMGMKLPIASTLQARAWIERYAGDWATAWRCLEELWPQLRESKGHWVATYDARFRVERATAALGALASGALSAKEARQARRAVRSDLKKLRGVGIEAADVGVNLLLAGLAALDGRDEASVRFLREGISHAERHQMQLYANAMRRRLGTLTGGEEGDRLIRAADDFFAEQGAVRPDLVAAMNVGGWPAV